MLQAVQRAFRLSERVPKGVSIDGLSTRTINTVRQGMTEVDEGRERGEAYISASKALLIGTDRGSNHPLAARPTDSHPTDRDM